MNQIKISVYNIRSIRRNLEQFISYTDNTSSDIIILTEIWLHESETHLWGIPGFRAFYQCNDRSRAEGVAVFVRNTLDAEQMELPLLQNVDALGVSVSLDNTRLTVVGL